MTHPPEPMEITPAKTAAMLGEQSAGAAPLLLDCRTVEEHRLTKISGDVLVPMDEIPGRLHDLDEYRDRPIIVYCHTGVRSRAVASFLREHGFARAQSMAGGIDRWSREVDPSVPRY